MYRQRSFIATSLLLACSIRFAPAQEEPSKLPIEVPKSASVTFEAEGAGKEFLTTIEHLLAGNVADPTAPPADKITIKTSLGEFDLKVKDLEPLLDKIHWLHLVSYTANPHEDPFKYHEKQFLASGLKRIAYVPGSNGVLVCRHNGDLDCYGVVARQKDTVVVLRTEGAPGLGDLGKVIFETLSKSVSQAVAKKKHPHG